jgi:hypothetical protein
MTLGGISTILLGLQVHSDAYQTWSRNIALITTATVTLITGLLSFWNLDNYWLRRKTIYNALVVLKEKFEYIDALDPDDKDARMQAVFDEYLGILGKHTEYWESLMAKESKAADSQQRVARQANRD